jgi:hypothetical protein
MRAPSRSALRAMRALCPPCAHARPPCARPPPVRVRGVAPARSPRAQLRASAAAVTLVRLVLVVQLRRAAAPRLTPRPQGVSAAGGEKAAAKPDAGATQQLQRTLSASTSAEEVLRLCASHAGALDHIHAATALNRLGAFCGSSAARQALAADPRAHTLADALLARCARLNAQGVANVLWAYARLSPELAPAAALLAALEAAAGKPSLWADAAPQAVANAAWAYVRLTGSNANRCAPGARAAARWHTPPLTRRPAVSSPLTVCAVRCWTCSRLPPRRAPQSSRPRSWRSCCTRLGALRTRPRRRAGRSASGTPAPTRSRSSSRTSWPSCCGPSRASTAPRATTRCALQPRSWLQAQAAATCRCPGGVGNAARSRLLCARG